MMEFQPTKIFLRLTAQIGDETFSRTPRVFAVTYSDVFCNFWNFSPSIVFQKVLICTSVVVTLVRSRPIYPFSTSAHLSKSTNCTYWCLRHTCSVVCSGLAMPNGTWGSLKNCCLPPPFLTLCKSVIYVIR